MQEDVTSRISKARGLFLQLKKKVWKNWKISVGSKIRLLEPTVMRVIKYGPEGWGFEKTRDSLYVFQRNYLSIVLGSRLTDLISYSKLCKKCDSIPLSRAIIRERMRWMRWKDERLSLSFNHLGPNGKHIVPEQGENIVRKDLREMGTSLENVKREALNRSGWERSVRGYLGLRWLGDTVSQ